MSSVYEAINRQLVVELLDVKEQLRLALEKLAANQERTYLMQLHDVRAHLRLAEDRIGFQELELLRLKIFNNNLQTEVAFLKEQNRQHVALAAHLQSCLQQVLSQNIPVNPQPRPEPANNFISEQTSYKVDNDEPYKAEKLESIAKKLQISYNVKPFSVVSSETSKTESSQVDENHNHIKAYDQSEMRLFVGGLCPTTDEQSIKSYFEKFGNIADVFLPKQKGSDSHRGFAFVEFSSFFGEHPVKLKHTLHERKLNIDLSCYAKNDEEPSNTILTSGNIQNTSNDALMTYFSKFGPVVDIIRSRESRNAFGRFAFIVFRKIKHANKVFTAGPHLIDGKSVDCRRARNFESEKSIKKTDSVPSLTSSSKSSLTESVMKLHIANLSSDTTVEMIKKHFSKFGTVHDAYIPLHYGTTESKGIGYVVMNTKEVKFNFGGQAIKGRTLKISKTFSDDAPPSSEKSNTLLVSAGPDTMGKISEAELQIFFSKFGEIKSVRKFKNRATKSSSHYAFVEYTTEKSVEKAIKKHSYTIKDHIVTVAMSRHAQR